MLNSSRLDDWNEKINDGSTNLFLFWQQNKAKHASKLEALDLYIQNAYDQLSFFRSPFYTQNHNITTDELLANVMKMVE